MSTVTVDVPEAALPFGFLNSRNAAATSRTLMLSELRTLLGAVPPTFSQVDLRRAVVDENILQKPTVATRQRTLQYLTDRYTLDDSVPLFRALRVLWAADEQAQPVMALLCAAARDPILRASADVILSRQVGDVVGGVDFSKVLAEVFPGAYSAQTLKDTGARLTSSWVQSGHVSGARTKVRSRPVVRPVLVAYALLLGHLCQEGAESLFQTFWAQLLDVPAYEVRELAVEASRQGWIELRQGGNATNVGFRHLLPELETRGPR